MFLTEPSMAEVRLQADPQLAQIEEHFAFVNTILKMQRVAKALRLALTAAAATECRAA